MENFEQGIIHPVEQKVEKELDLEDLSSWSLEELKKVHAEKTSRREMLISTPRSAVNRIGEAKQLAKVCRELLTEIEKREQGTIQ